MLTTLVGMGVAMLAMQVYLRTDNHNLKVLMGMLFCVCCMVSIGAIALTILPI